MQKDSYDKWIPCKDILNNKSLVMVSTVVKNAHGPEGESCQKNITEVFYAVNNKKCGLNEESYISWENLRNISFKGISHLCQSAANQGKGWFNNKLYCGNLFGESKDSQQAFGAIGKNIGAVVDNIRQSNQPELSCFSQMKNKLVEQDVCVYLETSGSSVFGSHITLGPEWFSDNHYVKRIMRAFANLPENCELPPSASEIVENFFVGIGKEKTETATHVEWDYITTVSNLIHQTSSIINNTVDTHLSSDSSNEDHLGSVIGSVIGIGIRSYRKNVDTKKMKDM